MRRALVVAGLASCLGACSRNFPTPPAAGVTPPGQLRANPAALLLAVDEEGVVSLSGGYPPYQVSALTGGDCTGTLQGGDGGVLLFPGCLVPFFQNTLEVTDADGGTLSIPVSIGAPFQSSLAATVHAQSCAELPMTLSGGQSPYRLILTDGGAPPSCGDGGLEGLALTSYQYRVPAYSPQSDNTYALRLLDQVEFAREPNPNLNNVVDFTLVVDPPQASLPGPLAANPAALLLAVDEPGTVSVSGGYPPYAVRSLSDAGSGATFDGGDGGVLFFPGHLTPNFQDTLVVTDASDGGALFIPVAIGSAFQSSVPSLVHAQGCADLQLSLTGGLAPYHLVQADGSAPPSCGDGGLVALGLTTFQYQVPAYSPQGSNTYSLVLLDQVEFANEPNPNPQNVVPFTLVVDPPQSGPLTANPAALLLAVAQPGTVTLSGGAPPYALRSVADGGCGATLDGGTVYFAGCSRPFFQDTLQVTDASDGGTLSIPVSIQV